ncbi:rhomboid family intramembrane serine protease [Candidatus Pacearchaeota archaeon]|nr:rhomboid family intramembrane serine protease [Candidatus Pacearchaeota archaeon]
MQKNRFYTIWIALLIVIIFVIQTIFPGFTEVFNLTSSSWTQSWRFLTSIFLHGSLAHLLSNLFALILFGLILEKTIGSNKFLLVFIISGILANLVAINFYPSSLGASGAIMGIIGTLAVIRPLMGVWIYGMIVPMFIASIIWIVVDAIGIFIPDNVFRSNYETRRKRHMIEVPEHLLRKWETLYMGRD